MQPHHRAHFTSQIEVADFQKNTLTYATFNRNLLLRKGLPLMGKLTRPHDFREVGLNWNFRMSGSFQINPGTFGFGKLFRFGRLALGTFGCALSLTFNGKNKNLLPLVRCFLHNLILTLLECVTGQMILIYNFPTLLNFLQTIVQ